jgi:hypothetical protein
VAEPWGLLSAPPESELLLRPLSERATELAVAVSAEAVKSVLVHGPELWFVLLGLSKKKISRELCLTHPSCGREYDRHLPILVR